MATKQTARNGDWENRIVAHGTIDPQQLLANPRNWRIHPTMQQDVLTETLDKVGWVDEITVNQRTGFVLDGHLRVQLALRRHEKTVPVKIVDLSEQEEELILTVLDPIAAMAQPDTSKFAELLEDIGEQEEATTLLLKRLAGDPASVDIDALYRGMPAYDQDANEQPLQTIAVHFFSKKAITQFNEAFGVEVNPSTTFINLPYRKRSSKAHLQVHEA